MAREELSLEWSDVAVQAARNLGLDTSPAYVSDEHWQRILASVEIRMRMRGIEAPVGWREDLAARFCRDERHARPESDEDFAGCQSDSEEGGYDGPES